MRKTYNKGNKPKLKKTVRRDKIEKDSSYRFIMQIANIMDNKFLDPIIGFFLPAAGDILASFMTLPFIYISLYKIKSIPLTLTIIYNMLIDVLLGMMPYCLGDVLDAVNRSYIKNINLIKGFVENNPSVINKVNQRAWTTLVFIVIICIVIIFIITFLVSLLNSSFDLMVNLFD